MAVAPINKVRQVVEYAVTEIDNRKINLGIPNYGYDWPLPFVQGETAATTIGNVQAVQIAVEQGVEIQYDETAQSPFFYYTENGLEHVVWFEDVRSMRAKFDLIREFQLKGGGYWNIMSWFYANWILADNTFVINK
ncbi:MAG: glycosyl hydrolase family 18 protein [Alistipes sp.]|nr:glycosyl hydrolase family 18 protein [Alistipes sp.]